MESNAVQIMESNTMEVLEFILSAVTTIGGFIGLYLFYKRLQEQEKQTANQKTQIDIQINQRIDERFTTAVSLLGSAESSARTGAIYSLYQLALEEEKYRKEITQILCSHIRSKTQEETYQDKHKQRPSNEIQTTINLLFKKDILYEKFPNLPKADLSHSYLNGADFRSAQCQGAFFWSAQCQRADFRSAQCQGAFFWSAQCQRADFRFAQCQGADFGSAQCQGAFFWSAQCQGADFRFAQCQGAHSLDSFLSFRERIGKDTDLTNVIFAGAINKDAIEGIKKAKQYLSEKWYEKMEKIIKDNKNKEISHALPPGIITGKLEDSEEIQKIIKEIYQAK